MQYFLLFLEGILTFISPCLLPMIPIYISFFAAGEQNRKKTLANSLGFILGFTIVFVCLGAFAGVIGKLVTQYSTLVNIITGTIIIVLGLNFIGVINISFLNTSKIFNGNTKNLNFISTVIFGITFSISWTPCVGAFLGSALMIASREGETIKGILMLLLYSLGLGIPFVASALLIDKLKGTFDFIKRNYRTINIFCGCLLIVTGIIMATGMLGKLFSLLTF